MTRAELIKLSISAATHIANNKHHREHRCKLGMGKIHGAFYLQLEGGKGLFKSEFMIFDYTDDDAATAAVGCFNDFASANIPYSVFELEAKAYAANESRKLKDVA